MDLKMDCFEHKNNVAHKRDILLPVSICSCDDRDDSTDTCWIKSSSAKELFSVFRALRS